MYLQLNEFLQEEEKKNALDMHVVLQDRDTWKQIHILEWRRQCHLLCDCNTTVQSIGRESTAEHHCTRAWSQDLANTGRRIIFHCFTVSSNPNGLHETLSQEKDPNKKRKHIINRVVMDLKETASFLLLLLHLFVCSIWAPSQYMWDGQRAV